MSTINSQEIVAELVGRAKRHSGNLAVMAGHQILDENLRNSNTLGVFSEKTWQMGCDIVDQTKIALQQVGIFSLINDWKYLPRGRSGDLERQRYWNNQENNFSMYSRFIQPHLLAGRSFKNRQAVGKFSEHSLQNRYLRLCKNEKFYQAAVDHALQQEDLEGPNSSQISQLLYAQEQFSSDVVVLLQNLHQRNFRQVMMFFPNQRYELVERATRVIKNSVSVILGEGAKMAFCNVYLNGLAPKNEGDLFIEHAAIKQINSHAIK